MLRKTTSSGYQTPYSISAQMRLRPRFIAAVNRSMNMQEEKQSPRKTSNNISFEEIVQPIVVVMRNS